MNDNNNAPKPFNACNIPTVAKRTTAKVARVMLIKKPLEANCPVMSSLFIISICIRLAYKKPLMRDHIVDHCNPFIQDIIRPIPKSRGVI